MANNLNDHITVQEARDAINILKQYVDEKLGVVNTSIADFPRLVTELSPKKISVFENDSLYTNTTSGIAEIYGTKIPDYVFTNQNVLSRTDAVFTKSLYAKLLNINYTDSQLESLKQEIQNKTDADLGEELSNNIVALTYKDAETSAILYALLSSDVRYELATSYDSEMKYYVLNEETGEYEDATKTTTPDNVTTRYIKTTNSIRDIATEEAQKIVDGASSAFDTLQEIETWINENQGTLNEFKDKLNRVELTDEEGSLNIYVKTGTIQGLLTTRDIVPAARATYSIGSDENSYANAYVAMTDTISNKSVVNKGYIDERFGNIVEEVKELNTGSKFSDGKNETEITELFSTHFAYITAANTIYELNEEFVAINNNINESNETIMTELLGEKVTGTTDYNILRLDTSDNYSLEQLKRDYSIEELTDSKDKAIALAEKIIELVGE